MPAIRVPVRRRFSDIDALGHVNNVVYLDYLQEARVHALWDAGVVEGVGFSHVVVRNEIDYRRALVLHEEPLIVEIWVSDIGRTSYTFSYRILDEEGRLASEAKSVMVAIDIETGTPMRISDELREALTALLV
jgi:acyl-CoA thioester hydrolase